MAKLLVEVQCGKKECGFCYMREGGKYWDPRPWCSLFMRKLSSRGFYEKIDRCQECLDAEVKDE